MTRYLDPANQTARMALLLQAPDEDRLTVARMIAAEQIRRAGGEVTDHGVEEVIGAWRGEGQ